MNRTPLPGMAAPPPDYYWRVWPCASLTGRVNIQLRRVRGSSDTVVAEKLAVDASPAAIASSTRSILIDLEKVRAVVGSYAGGGEPEYRQPPAPGTGAAGRGELSPTAERRLRSLGQGLGIAVLVGLVFSTIAAAVFLVLWQFVPAALCGLVAAALYRVTAYGLRSSSKK